MELEPIKTSEYVREKLLYKDGKLFWRESNGKTIKAGQLAGTMAGRGYRYIRIKKHKLPEHRVVWLYHYGEWPKNQIDHIDGNRANNDIENLRDVNQSSNNKNQALRKDNKSGYRGVTWYKYTNKWAVKIGDNKKIHRLGYFEDLTEAISMRLIAESHFGYDMPQRSEK
jgi:hypothetical protein